MNKILNFDMYMNVSHVSCPIAFYQKKYPFVEPIIKEFLEWTFERLSIACIVCTNIIYDIIYEDEDGCLYEQTSYVVCFMVVILL